MIIIIFMIIIMFMIIIIIIIGNFYFSLSLVLYIYIYIIYTYTHTHIYIYTYTHIITILFNDLLCLVSVSWSDPGTTKDSLTNSSRGDESPVDAWRAYLELRFSPLVPLDMGNLSGIV